tara:strand:- start:31 stop:147 length:117 start_codon:yes stop_codon:yes gene_type:complete
MIFFAPCVYGGLLKARQGITHPELTMLDRTFMQTLPLL